ncbi:MAG: ribonuclease P protein component [Acetobacterales bacterium]
MAPALSRLKRRAEFVRVTRQGRKAASAGLVLQAAPFENSDHDAFRVGFTVTRRVGNAVVRNRVRRRLRAVAQEIMPTGARPGFDYVLVGRAATKDRPYDALRRDLVSALGRLGLREKAGRNAAPARGKVT